MTGTTYDGNLELEVRGRWWRRTQRPPLSLTVLERADRLLVLPSDQSGGLRGGDRVTTRVRVAGHGRVEWRPPTSGLYFPSADRRGTCTVQTHIELGSGCRLAWLPPVAIPCTGARIEQTVMISLEPGVEFLYWDGWIDGRAASGERGGFSSISNDLEVRWDGRAVFRERWTLQGGGPGGPDPAGFHGACQWHLGIAAGPQSTRLLIDRVRTWQALGEMAEWGDHGELMVARVLSRQARAMPGSDR